MIFVRAIRHKNTTVWSDRETSITIQNTTIHTRGTLLLTTPESLCSHLLYTFNIIRPCPLYYTNHTHLTQQQQRRSKTMGLCSSTSTDINELSPDEKAQIAEDMGAEVENIVRIYSSIQYSIYSEQLCFVFHIAIRAPRYTIAIFHRNSSHMLTFLLPLLLLFLLSSLLRLETLRSHPARTQTLRSAFFRHRSLYHLVQIPFKMDLHKQPKTVSTTSSYKQVRTMSSLSKALVNTLWLKDQSQLQVSPNYKCWF